MQTKTIRGKKQQQHKTNNITKWLGKQQNMLAHFVYTQPIHKFHSDYTPGHNKALCILIRWATMRNARAFSLCFPCLPHRTIFWDGFIVVSSVFFAPSKPKKSTRHAQWTHVFFLVHFTFFYTIFFCSPALHISSGHSISKSDTNKATAAAASATATTTAKAMMMMMTKTNEKNINKPYTTHLSYRNIAVYILPQERRRWWCELHFHCAISHSIILFVSLSFSLRRRTLFAEQCFCWTLVFFLCAVQNCIRSAVFAHCSTRRYCWAGATLYGADVLFQDVKCAFGFRFVWFGLAQFGSVVTSSSVVVNNIFLLLQVFEPENGIEVFLNCF